MSSYDDSRSGCADLLKSILLIGMFLAFWAWIVVATKQENLSAGTEATSPGKQTVQDSPPPVAMREEPSTVLDTTSPGAQAPQLPADEHRELFPGWDSQSSPPAVILSEYEDSFLATPEGLWSMTGELWEQPEFLNLTQDEAHDLLDEEDYLGLHGPDRILDLVGPLPTREDCVEVLSSERAQAALEDVCALEVALERLGSIQDERRSKFVRYQIGDCIRERDRAMQSLMEELDRESKYKNWELYWKLYRRWSE